MQTETEDRGEPVSEFEAMVLLRLNAQQYWMTELFGLISGGLPGRMADMIKGKLESMENEPPIGPSHLSPAQLDQVMLAELPMVLAIGREMVEHLSAAQRVIDERKAQSAGPTFLP